MIKFLPMDGICAVPGYFLVTLAIGMGVACSSGDSFDDNSANGPEVLDNRLQLSLFAEDPDIMTPIGIAIDDRNRIFVLESHTHLEPSDYEGPDSDRIKIFSDEDGDGQPEDISVFAEGFDDGMNIQFSPEGHLYLVTAREVWVFYDRNQDGVSDDREKLLEITEPDYVYDHAALMGITFSHDGWMYVSRGNVGSAGWKMEGTDGSSVEGYGDGGNIVRARPDGSQLQEVATGFWNPFDLKFDDQSRLLVSDNDPDSRGPNRLVHIIEGGDYGYKSLYGGSGIHPYLAWNGELPGTLPYAAGLGEAPSGLLNASLTSFPEDYKGEMVISIWEESSIVRTNLSSNGTSVTGNTEVLVQGDKEFRPVSFAADTSGAIYFTDWVIREYPNHGTGRIWKLENKSSEKMEPRDKYAAPLPNPEGEPLQEMYTFESADDFNKLRQALTSEDPFLRNAAITVLSKPVFQSQVVKATRSDNADVRLGSMIALHRSGYEDIEQIVRRSLTDGDLRIRQYGLKWTGRAGLTTFEGGY
ncbi:MAG: PVC-type heme-binding CxxCH protein [Balneolaceae bacterium]|nr:PVC-type heme-binding CxxCH protein [Balneolaceae bacterium]